MKLLIFSFLFISCNEIVLNEELKNKLYENNLDNINSLSDNPSNTKKLLACEEISDNLIKNGDFSFPVVTDWFILNSSDYSSLHWQVQWKNKKPCGKNIVSPRLEIQSNGYEQWLELDSDCQGNNQFSFEYPIRKEKTKIKVFQNIQTKINSYYKLSFEIAKRNENVLEDLKVHFGNKKRKILNKKLSMNWQEYEFVFKANKDITKLMFNPIKGKSDTFGLFIKNVSLKEIHKCNKVKNKCKNLSSVIEYNYKGNIAENRKNILEILGDSDGEPYNANDINFISLGFGGDVIVKFNKPIKNINGFDLRIYETTDGNLSFNEYPEEAEVYASNNLKKWHYLGTVKNENNNPEFGKVELGNLKKAKYIKLIDITNPSTGGDGFDLDSMSCL